ncbi:MAG: hypothetical protein V4625_11460 [Pseudomonadota bacterium]
MSDAPPPKPRRQGLIGYWWAPVALIAVVLAVMAYLHPYQPLMLSDVPPEVVSSAAALDKNFGERVNRTFKYAIRRSYASPSGVMQVEIRSTLQPLENGLVMRQDDWYDIKGRSVVYQERYILFRNLFSVHTRSREVAPLVHDLMGRVGWYNDSARTIASQLTGSTPDAPDWKLDMVMARASDTDGKGLTVQTTNYQRKVHCERTGNLDAADIGAVAKGSYPRISCLSTSNDQQAERRSEYVWLPQHGIFLLLAYRQKGENMTTPTDNPGELAVKGNLLSFESLPLSD